MFINHRLRRSSQKPSEITLVNGTYAYNTSSSTSLNIALPSGIRNQDLLLLFTFEDNTTYLDSKTTPYISTSLVGGTSGGLGYRARYGFVEGSLPSTIILTSNNPFMAAACILAFRGADIDTAAFDSSGTVSPSLTVAEDNSYLAGGFGTLSTGTTCGTPSGMTTLFTDNNAYTPSVKIAGQSINSGSTGGKTSSGADAGIIVSLKPRYA